MTPHQSNADSHDVSEDELQDLSRLAVSLANQAAELLMKNLGSSHQSVSTKSSPTDMVSAVDRASERLIAQAIRSARPRDAILGEEGTNQPGVSGVRWVIDPLDGTTNYLYSFPGFSVSIAVILGDRSEIGVVVDPSRDETFIARRGQGSTCNGNPIRVNTRSDLGEALVATGFGYDPARREEQGIVLSHLLPAVRDIRRVGSCAIDLCWVACGRLDAYFERGPQPWDHAAGLLIAEEAGARTAWTEVGAPGGDLIMAGSPGLFEALASHVQLRD